MRVAHVHRMRGIGGSERHLLTLLPALAERGADPVLVGLDDPAWDAEPFYRELDVPSVRLRAPRDLDPALLASLGRELRRLRPDLVHTHLVHADMYGAVVARAPLVSTKHNDDPFRLGSFRHVERVLARRFGRVIAITEALARFTVERVGLPAAKVEVVHYGLDEPPSAWGANPRVLLPDGARVLLAISRLTAQKGIDVAV
nr:glycosyltransferase family 4 protein [Actinomycetota bacterium]